MNYTETVTLIATLADKFVEIGDMPAERAIDMTAEYLIRDNGLAKRRQGFYKYETPSEVFEEVAFNAMVAEDVLDGVTSRPSVGNVREAVRSRMSS